MKIITFFFCLQFGILFASPELIISPQSAFLNEIISIEVKGLNPLQEIEISASMNDESSRKWMSTAKFQADSNGLVQTKTQSPLSGTYSEIDPMGLFWSMIQVPSNSQSVMFSKRNLDPVTVEIQVKSTQGEILKGNVKRVVVKEGVKKIPISEHGMVANLFLPEGSGPFPGIIFIPGLGGGMPADASAVQFANHGYAVLALAYFGLKGLPDKPQQIPLEYFFKTIQWMKKRTEIDTKHLILLGDSFDGGTALLVASHSPDVKAVISFCGRGIITQAGSPGVTGAPFTFKGKDLPYIPLKAMPSKINVEDIPYYFLDLLYGGLFAQNKKNIEAATIKVEKINGPILMFAGLDDRLANSVFLSEISYERLVSHHFPYDFHLITYAGTGHTVGVWRLPYFPTTNLFFTAESTQIRYYFGGNPQDTAKAQADCWNRTFRFLQKHTR